MKHYTAGPWEQTTKFDHLTDLTDAEWNKLQERLEEQAKWYGSLSDGIDVIDEFLNDEDTSVLERVSALSKLRRARLIFVDVDNDVVTYHYPENGKQSEVFWDVLNMAL